jgi:hypothetical protein
MLFMHGYAESDGVWYARSDDLLHWTAKGKILDGDIQLQTWSVVQDADSVTFRLYQRAQYYDGGGVYEATVPRAAGCSKLGDVNCDSSVDIIDLVIIAQNFNKSSGFYEGADQNNDGRVDIVDLVIVAQNFG